MNLFAAKPLASRRIFFAGILLFGLLAMTARPAVDPDLWWHLRTGQWIVETGHIPRADPFSFTRNGSPWVSHEWLSEVLFFELWSHGGPAPLIVFSSIVTTAGFLLLYLRCPGKPHWAAAVTVLGAWASAPSWGVRPQMFTFMLASLLLWLIEQGEDRPRLLLWVPPLFLLWLNLHAGFALGPALLFLYAAGLIFEVATGSAAWLRARPIIVRLLLITAACMALVPLNPSGWQLYRYPLDTLRSPGMRSFIVEWFSPDFHRWLYAPFLLVFLFLLIALASAHVRVQARVLLPLLFAALAAFDAVRHIPIVILLAIPVIASALPASSISPSISPRRPTRSHPRPLLGAAALILLAAFTLMEWLMLARTQSSREAHEFPQQAVSFLKAGNYPSRLFAYYDWGGYALWKLYPQYRVFADGRADLYGDDLLEQSIKTTLQLRQGWQVTLDTWDVETVLIPHSAALTQALSLDPHWRVAYRDPQAVVFIRAPAPVP